MKTDDLETVGNVHRASIRKQQNIASSTKNDWRICTTWRTACRVHKIVMSKKRDGNNIEGIVPRRKKHSRKYPTDIYRRVAITKFTKDELTCLSRAAHASQEAAQWSWVVPAFHVVSQSNTCSKRNPRRHEQHAQKTQNTWIRRSIRMSHEPVHMKRISGWIWQIPI